MNKLKPAAAALHMAKVIDAIDKAIRLGTIRYAVGKVYIFKEQFEASVNKKALVKNLYIYARLKKGFIESSNMRVLNIETAEQLAAYTNGNITF